MSDNDKIAALAAGFSKKYGHKSASIGSERVKLNVIPTGSLALDYMLGTGGWPLGHPIEVFGPPDIGKSSVIGLNAFRNAQKLGMGCALIALEPGFDPVWAERNGVDTDKLIILRPDNGEEAFDMLFDLVAEPLIDLIVFDSIGAVVTASELAQDEIKSKVGGQSKLITDGVKRILIPAWKNEKCVIFINQVRDKIGSPVQGAYESPGGHALKHSAAVRVQLKGKEIKERLDGNEVVVGRTITALAIRNKLCEGSKKRAEFDYYMLENDNHPLGVDIGKDVIASGIRTRVIEKAGAWFRHPSFPEGRLNGKDAVTEFLLANEDALQQVRDGVLDFMLNAVGEIKNVEPKEDSE